MSGKLSVGIYRDISVDGQWAIDELVALHPRAIFLAFGALSMARLLKDRIPGVVIVGRPDIPHNDAEIAKGYAGGYAMGRHCCAAYPDVDIWAPICEYITGAAPDNPEQKTEQYRRVEAQTAWELGFMDACVDGPKVICGNVASGILPMIEHADQVDKWMPHVKRLTQHSAYFGWGVHDYGTPESVAPGSRGRMMKPPSSYFALRHIGFDQAMLARGVDLQRIAATEHGCTDGWDGFISLDELVADWLAWADAVCPSERFWCAFYFLNGTDHPGPNDKWKRFEIQGRNVCARIGEWNRVHPVAGETQPQQGGDTVPEQFEYVLGFAEYAKQHPEIGKPTSPLMYDANGTAVQYTEKGMLHWNKASNQTLFFRASQ